MKVLYIASEALPFIASGGLADVAGSLPKALAKKGVECRVVLPLYSDIRPELREKMTPVVSYYVNVSWRNQYCGVYQAQADGIIYYLLDNEYYFKRKGTYGFYDDAERFAFFSMASLELVKHLDYAPDILHCNDWQTALVPVFLNLFYRCFEKLRGIKTVFTIHNIQYQGRFGMEICGDLLGLPRHKEGILEYDGCANYMKAAIDQSDRITTVSPTYAQEILDPWYAHGLDGLLVERQYKLSGILNGIDTDLYNPQTDPSIQAPFSAGQPAGKAEDKAALQKLMHLPENPQAMVMSLVTRMVSHKGLDLVKYIFGEILRSNIQVVVLGSGESGYEQFFTEMQRQYPEQVAVRLGFLPELARKIYAGSDAFLMPSKTEPCGLSQMVALRYGALPIVRETGGLKDSITDLGEPGGNGFTFKTYNAHDMLWAIQRAYNLFGDREKWSEAVRAALSCDFSWGRSAGQYLALYQELLGR